VTVIEGNRILAARARDLAGQAEPGTLARKAAGAASIALATTKSLTAARGVLDAWDGPGDVKAAAEQLLDDLASEDRFRTWTLLPPAQRTEIPRDDYRSSPQLPQASGDAAMSGDNSRQSQDAGPEEDAAAAGEGAEVKCADPACPFPLDAVWLELGDRVHPGCHDPEETQQ
jgi:hypothetical protein